LTNPSVNLTAIHSSAPKPNRRFPSGGRQADLVRRLFG
jgi:hypothetical protein